MSKYQNTYKERLIKIRAQSIEMKTNDHRVK